MSRSILYSLALVSPLLAAPVLADSPWGGSVGASVMVTPDYLGVSKLHLSGLWV
ncbi:MAG: hypothetical protein GX324_00125 [Aeromonadales bacterium]|nr:hypothetical protein [Aeromonadales bacterium]